MVYTHGRVANTHQDRLKPIFQENIMKLGRVNWLCALRRSLFATVLAALAPFAYADSEYAAAWGPSIGSTVPMLSALDQDGNQQDLESLTGSEGLLFVFNRSVDW
jgi:hypothetical protein